MGEEPQVTLARRGPLPEPEALAQTRAQYEADLAESMFVTPRELAAIYNEQASDFERMAHEYRMKAQDLIINAQESEAPKNRITHGWMGEPFPEKGTEMINENGERLKF